MRERDKIKQQFEKFICALEKNDMSYLETVISSDCRMQSETVGEAEGLEIIKQKLKWRGPALDYSRYRIYNTCIFQKEDRAVQSSYVVATVGVKENYYLHWFTFGGHYLIDWKKEAEEWKMNHIRYCHDMECGNTAFVKDWWKLIDYDTWMGYEKHPICSAKEAPWRVMNNYEDWTEEEKIADLFCRYAWGIDEDDFEITESVMAENIQTNIPGKSFEGKGKLISMLEQKRKKENSMSHVGKIVSIKQTGDKAEMVVWRYEPHRIGTKFTHAGNIDTMFYSVDYLWHLEKQNDRWRVTGIDYNIGVFGEKDDGRYYQ